MLEPAGCAVAGCYPHASRCTALLQLKMAGIFPLTLQCDICKSYECDTSKIYWNNIQYFFYEIAYNKVINE